MDLLLQRVTQQALQYAVRSGISITTGYCVRECGRLLKQAPKSRERDELMQLQLRLESKLKVLAPPMDMIELIAARGNTSLESALSLCKDLRQDIQKLAVRFDKAAQGEQHLRQHGCKDSTREDADHELAAIITQAKLLLIRIEDAIPLISLAITTSGVNLSTKLSGTISPSRLLQSSTFLTAADSAFASRPTIRHQVGPTYVVTLYMLFAAHAGRENGHDATWKEVIPKARVKLWRVPLDQLYGLPGETVTTHVHDPSAIPAEAKAAEFAYQLTIVQDLDDDRVHTFEEGEPQPGPFDDVHQAGIRDVVPIHEVSKIFYADSGKILNIAGDDEITYPCLLLKRDVHAEPPRRMAKPSLSRSSSIAYGIGDDEDKEQSQIDAQIERESTPIVAEAEDSHDLSSWRLPADLDPEWMAFQVYTAEDEELSSDDEDSFDRPTSSQSASLNTGLAGALSDLHLASEQPQAMTFALSPAKHRGPVIKTTLSLLEMLLKLTALQQFRQESHLGIEDELLNFFLEDSATAGAGADKQHRQQVRHAAIQRVGFDPYDESPIKRRGEEYIRGAGGSPRSVRGSPASTNGSPYANGQTYRTPMPYPGSPGYSSPLPAVHRLAREQTPSRSYAPDSTGKLHRSAIQAKLDKERTMLDGPATLSNKTDATSGELLEQLGALASPVENTG